MKILLLSFYYPPDLAAGSFRAEALVKALLSEGGEAVHVDLLSTQPNRYNSFNQEASACEVLPGLRIRRIAIPGHQSGLADQAWAFLRFAIEAHRLTRGESYDLVVATSSRLMTATLGAWLARRRGAGLYLDIRDIFVDTLSDLLPSRVGQVLTLGFSWLERWTIGQADKVSLVSPGFLPYFKMRYPERTFSVHKNGVDELFHAQESSPVLVPTNRGRLRVVYAGNIGAGQGLHHILPALAKRLEGEAEFLIIGDGGQLFQLKTALRREGVTNVQLLPPIARRELLAVYQDADVLFLHLNQLQAFRRVLPSKLFEYAATGKPVWAGFSGYAAKFANAKIDNAQVFSPGDVEGAVTALRSLVLLPRPRAEFITRYSRKVIMQAMAVDVLNLIELNARTHR